MDLKKKKIEHLNVCSINIIFYPYALHSDYPIVVLLESAALHHYPRLAIMLPITHVVLSNTVIGRSNSLVRCFEYES